MKQLDKKLGTMTYDGLIADVLPHTLVGGGTIAALDAEATLVRGTLLAKNGAGKLIVLGSGGTAGTWNGTGDGTTVKFNLVTGATVPTGITEVKVNSVAVTTGWSYNAATGDLIFESAPTNTHTIAVKTVTDDSVPDCILCDDIVVGTADDVSTEVYTAGCFDPAFVTVAEGYTITAADIDALRIRGIVFKDKATR